MSGCICTLLKHSTLAVLFSLDDIIEEKKNPSLLGKAKVSSNKQDQEEESK